MTVTLAVWNILDRQRVSATCPYCGTVVDVYVEAGLQIACCDAEDAPGCGKDFVVSLPLHALIEVKSFKIEAE